MSDKANLPPTPGEVLALVEAARPVLVYIDAVLRHARPTNPQNAGLLLGMAFEMRAALAPFEGKAEPTGGPACDGFADCVAGFHAWNCILSGAAYQPTREPRK